MRRVVIELIFLTSFFLGQYCKIPSLSLTLTQKSLAQCLLKSSKAYFPDGQTISFLDGLHRRGPSPISFNDYLLKVFNLNESWTLNLYNLTKTYKHERFFKSCCFIVKINDRDDLKEQLKWLERSRSWNPNGLFIVFSTTKFGKMRQVVKETMKSLWEKHVLRGVVLVVDGTKLGRFNVYSYEPFGHGNCGENFENIALVDRCFNGEFNTSINWFKRIVPRRLNNCLVKVHYENYPPFFVGVKNGSKSNESHSVPSGVEFNILQVIAKSNGLVMEYFETKSFGDVFNNGSITGDHLNLLQQKFDVLLSGAYYTLSRARLFDTTLTHGVDHFVLVLPHVPVSVQINNFTTIIEKHVWLVILVTFLVITLLVWFLDTKKPLQDICLKNLAIVFSSATKLSNTRSSIRFCTLLFVLTMFQVQLDYQTCLTSLLYVPTYKERFSTIEDILQENLTIYYVENSERYFEDLPIIRRGRRCYDTYKCIQQVANNKNCVVLLSESYKDYIKYGFYDSDGNGLLHFIGPIMTARITMLLRPGFPFIDQFNTVINRLLSAGLINYWYKENYEKMKRTYSRFWHDDDKVLGYYLGLSNLKQIFCFWACGLAFAFVVFLVELLANLQFTKPFFYYLLFF